VCDYGVSKNKITTYANAHVKEGNDFKGVEGPATPVECPADEPLLAELKAFLKSIETRQAPLADGWSGYHSVRVLDAALRSAKTQSPVSLA
jgi:predicted dehydrogenase